MTKIPAARRKTWERWSLNEVFQIQTNGSVMLTRRRLIQTPLFGVYLHSHEREDSYRALHDHPWGFISIILRGAYTERVAQVQDGALSLRTLKWRKRFSIHFMPAAKKAHVIIGVSPNTVSLLFVGRKKRLWGFYTENGWVPWTDYSE